MSYATSEASARAAAEAYVAEKGAKMAHSEVVTLSIQNGDLVTGSPAGTQPGTVVSIAVLHALNTAVAQVQWDDRAGWLTLLLEGGSWAVISDVTSKVERPFTISPREMTAALSACWEEYCGANRVCDGARMAQIFHPLCRLTYTGPDGSVVIKPRALTPCIKSNVATLAARFASSLHVRARLSAFAEDVFVTMVSERYSTPLHAPYAHLQGDPRVGAHDTLLGVTFATPDVAMVVLKVGHPPMLWTDVLTCARLAGDRWWIVAKSSCSEPLLADEAQ